MSSRSPSPSTLLVDLPVLGEQAHLHGAESGPRNSKRCTSSPISDSIPSAPEDPLSYIYKKQGGPWRAKRHPCLKGPALLRLELQGKYEKLEGTVSLWLQSKRVSLTLSGSGYGSL